MKTILILGNDKLCQLAICGLVLNSHFKILIFKNSIKKIFILIAKRVLNPLVFLKMLLCEFYRKGFLNTESFESIKNNKELLSFVEKNNIKKIILFRTGLIINRTLIEKKITILNIHAAMVPKYGGIGSIQKALKEKKFNQYASLHTVTTKIDKGRVLDKENYTLSPNKSYCFNEDVAYQASIRLLYRTLLKCKKIY